MKFKLQQQQFHLPIGKLLLIVDTGTSEGSIITFIQIQIGGIPITSKHRDMIATEICLLQTFYSHKINF